MKSESRERCHTTNTHTHTQSTDVKLDNLTCNKKSANCKILMQKKRM